jgi:transposase
MNVHKNARLTPRGRVLMIERIEKGLSVRRAATEAGVSERTAHLWLRRWRFGDRELLDRSSAPRRCPRCASGEHGSGILLFLRRLVQRPPEAVDVVSAPEAGYWIAGRSRGTFRWGNTAIARRC